MRMAFLAIFLASFLICSSIAIVNMGQASAWVPEQNTWISDDDGLASDSGNWENGTPFMDQVLWFTGDHNGNCTWDFIPQQMAWGWNINRFASILFVNYTGSIEMETYIYIYQGTIPYPIEPGPDPHFPGPFDWLYMSNQMLLLVVLLAGGLIFLFIMAIISRRR